MRPWQDRRRARTPCAPAPEASATRARRRWRRTGGRSDPGGRTHRPAFERYRCDGRASGSREIDASHERRLGCVIEDIDEQVAAGDGDEAAEGAIQDGVAVAVKLADAVHR